MAHINEVFVDLGHGSIPDDTPSYDLMSSDSRCSCCPYGFHVDKSFVHYTDTLKRGKHLQYSHTIHGGRSLHLQPNQPPDLIMHHGDNAALGGMDSNRDDFAVFGTRTERRKKKKKSKSSSLDIDYSERLYHTLPHTQKELLDISLPDDMIDKQKTLFSTDEVFVNETHETKHSSSRYSPQLIRTDENFYGPKSGPDECSVCPDPNCPECLASGIPDCVYHHHETCCHNDGTCVDCCSDVCCTDSYCLQRNSHNEKPQREIPEKLEHEEMPPEMQNISPPERMKMVEFDPEKISELREHVIKLMNRIHEQDKQLQTLPVIQVRMSALQEENSILHKRLSGHKRTIDQLSSELETEKKRKHDKKSNVFNSITQTELSINPTQSNFEFSEPDFMKGLSRPESKKKSFVDKGLSPIFPSPFLESRSAQTMQETEEVDDEMYERPVRPKRMPKPHRRPKGNVDDISIPPLRDVSVPYSHRPSALHPNGHPVDEDFIVPKRKKEVSVSTAPRYPRRDTGVGNHDIRSIYALEPNGLNIEDLPESFVRQLKEMWDAALPKRPRMVNAGVNNVPQWHHKGVCATEPMKTVGLGDHEVDHLYFLQPRNASEDELPPVILKHMRNQWESELPPKPYTFSIGVSAVQSQRNQLVETELQTENTAVGSHDISELYFLQPHLLRTDELPRDAVRLLVEEWEALLPKKPQLAVSSIQCGWETADQSVETDRPSLSSIGVGEHDISRFYLLEYQPFRGESELPPELLAQIKQAWHEKWENSLPRRPELVTTSTTYLRPQSHRSVSTENRRQVSVGVGENDISTIYFLQPDAASEYDIPRHLLLPWEKRLREAWLNSLPKLTDSAVEYRGSTHNRGVATKQLSLRHVGLGDRSIDQVYFLQPDNAKEQDLPAKYLSKLKREWQEVVDRSLPIKPRLITRATSCSLSHIRANYRHVGTMSEDPQPIMFDEGVGVDLDEEEWTDAQQVISWSNLYPISSSAVQENTSVKSIVERLHYAYRFEKSEFISLLTRLLSRHVQSRATQASSPLSETATVYSSPISTISRGVSDDTVNVVVYCPSSRSSIGIQIRPLLINKFCNTDRLYNNSRGTNTENRLQDRAITYRKPENVTQKGTNTEKVRTRDVIVWAELIQAPSLGNSVGDEEEEDGFVEETWEELSVFDPDGNVVRSERLPLTGASAHGTQEAQGESGSIQDSRSSREEGGRYEHYYVSRGNSRSSSTVGEAGTTGSGAISIPSTPAAFESVSSGNTQSTSSSFTKDFVPRTPTDSHPHVHVCGTDPASGFEGQLSPGQRSQESVGHASVTLSSSERSSTKTEFSVSLRQHTHSDAFGVPQSSNASQNKTSTSLDIRSGREAHQTQQRQPTGPVTVPVLKVDGANADKNAAALHPPQSSASGSQRSQVSVGRDSTTLSSSERSSTKTEFNVSSRQHTHPDSSAASQSFSGSQNKTSTSLDIKSGREAHQTQQRQPTGSVTVPLLKVDGADADKNAAAIHPSQSSSSGRMATVDTKASSASQDSRRDRTENSDLSYSQTRRFHQKQESSRSDGTRLQSTTTTSAVTAKSKDAAGTPTSSERSSTKTVSSRQHTQNREGDSGERTSYRGDTSSSKHSSIRQGGSVEVKAKAPVTSSQAGPDSQLHVGDSNYNRSESYSLKSSRTVSSTTRVTATTTAVSGQLDSTYGSEMAADQKSSSDSVTEPPPGQLRPLFSTTWSSPDYSGSRSTNIKTSEKSSVSHSTSHVVAKDGHVVQRLTTTEKVTSSPSAEGTSSSRTSQSTLARGVTSTTKQVNESDEDSVFLTPDKNRQARGRGSSRSTRDFKSRQPLGARQFGGRRGAASATRESDQSSGGITEKSLSTPTSPRSPRSIMKRNSDEDQETHYNTLPLLRKKKGIRFAGDTKSESVSSSSYSEGENASDDEGTYEMEFVQKLERLRENRNIPNRAILERYNLSPKMRECCDVIAEWLNDSTKFTSKQMNEAISNLRREWFVASAGRQADSAQVAKCLEAFQQFNPTLLEMIVNLADDNGNTALHYAVSREQWAVVARLLDTNRVRVNRANKAGYTPLMLAALCRDAVDSVRPVISRLLASGHINQGSSVAGQTALMLAASHGRTGMVHMLLESGADPNRRDREGSTALMCASEHGHLEAARILLASSHCDPNIKDNDGSTALTIALETKHRDIALLIYARTNLKDNQSSKKS